MAEWESIIFSASRPGLIPSRGKTTPSAERQQWEWVSPLTSATAWEDPLCSNPVVTSIPFDSCVKPPSFHSSLLHKLNSYPPAGTRRGERRETWGSLRCCCCPGSSFLFYLSDSDASAEVKVVQRVLPEPRGPVPPSVKNPKLLYRKSKTHCATFFQHTELHSQNQKTVLAF